MPQFDRRRLGWRAEDAAALREWAPQILCIWAAVVIIGIVLILKFAPAAFLSLPRSNPLFWGLIMVFYPTLSVYPQGIVYRVFMFERYRPLFGQEVVTRDGETIGKVKEVGSDTFDIQHGGAAGQLAARSFRSG